jgi:hypothetical protein
MCEWWSCQLLYSRLRSVTDLQPLLEAASPSNERQRKDIHVFIYSFLNDSISNSNYTSIGSSDWMIVYNKLETGVLKEVARA